MSAPRTSTSNGSASSPGFTPTFGAQGSGEGRQEGQEFASGMYGLMSAAVDYAQRHDRSGRHAVGAERDDLADADQPRAERVGAVGHLLHDRWLDPDDGLDSSTSRPGFREQEGATLTFSANTTLKYFAVDPKGNTSAVRTATYIVDAVAADDVGERGERRQVEPHDHADRDRRQLGRRVDELHGRRRLDADVHGAVLGVRRQSTRSRSGRWTTRATSRRRTR